MFTKKKIACPLCGFETLAIVNANRNFETVKEEKMPADWNPIGFTKCKRCKSEIAIREKK